MNRSPSDQKFFFLSPFVNEGRRIQEACPEKQFAVLEERRGSKLNDLRYHVNKGSNIASTHALLERYTPDILEKIKEGGYTLVLDEAYAVTKTVTPTQKRDFLCLLDAGIIGVDPETNLVSFAGGVSFGFEQSAMKGITEHIASGSVYFYENKLLIWIFPVNILEAFSEIILLTYMFKAQSIYHYLDLNGFSFDYWGTRKLSEGVYEFCKPSEADRPDAELASKIHILQNEKLNQIGKSERDLCSKWFAKDAMHNNGAKINQLAKNIRNVQKNIYGCPANQFMWTVYKKDRAAIEDKNIRPHWVQCSEKATNRWRHKRYLAYAINLFEHPDAYDYFQLFGRKLRDEDWALSEMIQWIWRSAIRDGEEIWIYIPSSRMRELLENWIEEVSSSENNANMEQIA